jgi:hypothetical protein
MESNEKVISTFKNAFGPPEGWTFEVCRGLFQYTEWTHILLCNLTGKGFLFLSPPLRNHFPNFHGRIDRPLCHAACNLPPPAICRRLQSAAACNLPPPAICRRLPPLGAARGAAANDASCKPAGIHKGVL